MASDPIVVDTETYVEEAVVIEERCGIRHLPVVEGGRLVGIVSDRDLAAAHLAGAGTALYAPEDPGLVLPRVCDLMSRDVVTVAPDDDVVVAAQRMLQHKIGSLPVVQNEDVIGIVTETDILRAFLKRCEDEPRDSCLNPLVTERMTRNLVRGQLRTPVLEAWSLCESADVRHLLVTAESGELLGIASDRDLRRAMAREDADELTLAEVMSKHVIQVGPDATLARAARLMVAEDIHGLPVVDRLEVQGILTTTDLLDHCMTAMDSSRDSNPVA